MEPTREEADALPGVTMLEFGTSWCGYCQAAQPLIREALDEQPGIRHLKIEDAREKKIGRTYRVKLWPTLILLKDGQEVARVVRPTGVAEIRDALARTC